MYSCIELGNSLLSEGVADKDDYCECCRIRSKPVDFIQFFVQ